MGTVVGFGWRLTTTTMRYELNDRQGKRLGVIHIEVDALQVMQAIQGMHCVLGRLLPTPIAAPVAMFAGEASTSGTTKRSRRGSRK